MSNLCGAACGERRKKFLPLEKEGRGVQLFQCLTLDEQNEGKLKDKEEKVHTRPGCLVTYQRTITGDRNYFGHRVQENCERKENCNA